MKRKNLYVREKNMELTPEERRRIRLAECEACLEKEVKTVGNWKICGRCFHYLTTVGHIELEGRRPYENTCLWLYPDGTTREMKLLLTKEDCTFIPYDQPVNNVTEEKECN
jgi:hypothetical protein